MKSTMLAAASQLGIAREDRLAQGHHRDSARTCSRNDTHCKWRPVGVPVAAWQEGDQRPFQNPPSALHSARLQNICHQVICRRAFGYAFLRVTMRSSSNSSSSSSIAVASTPSPTIQANSDSEAEAVKAYAEQNLESDEETNATQDQPRILYVCNGPWSCCHLPTEESALLYEASEPPQPQMLRARCGAKIGIAAQALRVSCPANPCRRKGCA